jgi:hypothetical protein
MSAERAQTKSEFDPNNKPLTTATAALHFVAVSGFNRDSIKRDGPYPPMLFFHWSGDPWTKGPSVIGRLVLTSKDFDAIGKDWYMHFAWSWISMPKQVVNVGSAFEHLDGCELIAVTAPSTLSATNVSEFVISGGEVTLTLNDVVQKKFVLPPQKSSVPILSLVGTAVETNASPAATK